MEDQMAKVLGIGGVFFKTAEPEKTKAWYVENLGLQTDEHGYVCLPWREKEQDREHFTAWSPFKQDTTYFEPSKKPYMVNYIVDDLDGMLAQLRAAGTQVDDNIQDEEGFGRFGWAMDPEGNRIELWQPPEAKVKSE